MLTQGLMSGKLVLCGRCITCVCVNDKWSMSCHVAILGVIISGEVTQLFFKKIAPTDVPFKHFENLLKCRLIGFKN